jgi:glycerophosphoryl diester phosphodiesterase
MRWFGKRECVVLGVVLAVVTGGCAGMGPGWCPTVQPPGRDFLIIGHRGAPHQACENTIESFVQALRLGANALELDVSMTSDGQLVLWHDEAPTVEIHLRPTGACRLVHPPRRQPVHQVMLTEFMRDYGYEQAGQRVPVTTLAEFVRRFARDDRVQRIFLDLKMPEELSSQVPPMFARAVQHLRQYGALPKAVFTTPYQGIFFPLHDEAQRWYRATGERVDIAWDTEGPPGLLPGEWPSAVQRNQTAGTRFALWGKPEVALQSPRDFLAQEVQRRNEVNTTRLPQEWMRFIVWTFNDENDLCAIVSLGVDGIMTDEPGRLRAIVQHGVAVGSRRSHASGMSVQPP